MIRYSLLNLQAENFKIQITSTILQVPKIYRWSFLQFRENPRSISPTVLFRVVQLSASLFAILISGQGLPRGILLKAIRAGPAHIPYT